MCNENSVIKKPLKPSEFLSQIPLKHRHTRYRVIDQTEDNKHGCISHMLAPVGLEDVIILLITLIIDDWSTMN